MLLNRSHDIRPDSERACIPVCLVVACSLLAMGFVCAPPAELFSGLCRILTSRALLLSDYFIIGGMGAAFFNAGLVMLLSMALLYFVKAKYTAGVIAGLFLMPGFALFGKDVFNIQPFFLGVFLYCRYMRVPMRKHVMAALYSTTLCPIVSEIFWNNPLPLPLRLLLGICAGALIGFAIVPLADHLMRSHKGYILFNYGFASGFIAMLAMAILLASGGTLPPSSLWYAGIDERVRTYLVVLCFLLVLLGLSLSGWNFTGLPKVFKVTGCAPDNNMFEAVGVGLTMVNMGVIGFISIGYILFIGGDFSGPVVGAIFTAIGFAAVGIQPRNFLPVLFSIWFFSLFGAHGTTDPSVQIAAIFGAAALSPVAGEYGFIAGFIAGLLHYALVTFTGQPTGGLNLYNNGFASGIVATIMVTMLDTFAPTRTAWRLAKKKQDKAARAAKEDEVHHGYHGA
ncbi:MAG: DUF1576 domain-containing protein [Clostridia bacterium]|nr:DUF1576 domain-containing protein [Clostridia bacterium]